MLANCCKIPAPKYSTEVKTDNGKSPFNQLSPNKIVLFEMMDSVCWWGRVFSRGR